MTSRPASADDIVDCYRTFFNREPESADVIESHLADRPTLSQFLEKVISAPEYAWAGQRAFTSIAWNPALYGRVDVTGNAADIDTLIAHTQKVWAAYGEQDPFWSVLTNEKYRATTIGQQDIDEFYATGATAFGVMQETLARNGLVLPTSGTALDLGCGLGRIGEHISAHMDSYVGVDISPSHLRQATERFDGLGRKNSRFMLLPELFNSDLEVDLAFSLIVLQHNPPPVIAILIQRLCELLRDDGILYFQVPVALSNYEFDLGRYIAAPPSHGEMEMHCIPQREVYRLLEANQCRLIEALPDNWIGSVGLSYTFIAQKRCG